MLRECQPAFPARPNPSTAYDRNMHPIRIGRLLYPDHSHDTWWYISTNRAATQTGPIANGVVDAVSSFAMPEIGRLTESES